MDIDGRAAEQVWAGLPQTEHSALTPLGEIEQATKIAAGLKRPRHGWRRVVAIVGFVVIAAAAAMTIVASILPARG